MPDSLLDLRFLAAIGCIFLLAGAVKGVIGMGLPTLAMGLLGLLVPPVQAAALLVLPSAVTNIWQYLAGLHARQLITRLWSMMLAQFLAVWLGAFLLISPNTALVSILLGVVLVVYSLISFLNWRWAVPPHRESVYSPLAGFASGLITGATGIMVIPAVPYLQALGMEKDELVQALGLSFSVSTLALMGVLTRSGHFSTDLSYPVLLALVAVCIGMLGGQQVRKRLAPTLFRRVFMICIGCIGVLLVLRNL